MPAKIKPTHGGAGEDEPQSNLSDSEAEITPKQATKKEKGKKALKKTKGKHIMKTNHQVIVQIQKQNLKQHQNPPKKKKL